MVKRTIVHKYYNHDSMKDYQCFYCGDRALGKDHVPPVSYPDEYEESYRMLVRCCVLCNSLLGKKGLLTLLARADYLLMAYQKRFLRLLSSPHWSNNEINELSGKLKNDLIRSIKKKEHIENRILFLTSTVKILQGYD